MANECFVYDLWNFSWLELSRGHICLKTALGITQYALVLSVVRLNQEKSMQVSVATLHGQVPQRKAESWSAERGSVQWKRDNSRRSSWCLGEYRPTSVSWTLFWANGVLMKIFFRGISWGRVLVVVVRNSIVSSPQTTTPDNFLIPSLFWIQICI